MGTKNEAAGYAGSQFLKSIFICKRRIKAAASTLSSITQIKQDNTGQLRRSFVKQSMNKTPISPQRSADNQIAGCLSPQPKHERGWFYSQGYKNIVFN